MKTKLKHIFIFGIAVLLIYSCNNVPQLVKYKGKALGTFYSISYYDVEGRNFQKETDSLFAEFNHVLSIYDSTSVISKINRNDPTTLHEWFVKVFNTSLQVYQSSEGCFDPTVGPLVNAWGFGFTNAEDMTQEKVDSLLKFVGFSKIKIANGKVIKEDNRITLDFNAVAKGYCSDVAAEFLTKKGITSYLVEIGGEIVSQGTKPDGSLWKIGIEKPSETAVSEQVVMQTIKISDKALATSGNYRKYYIKNGKRFAHTIDPFTGFPSDNSLLSATVIANDCITADAYATAFMVMGLEKAFAFASSHPELDAFFIYTDTDNKYQTKFTKGFEKYLE